MTNDWGESRYEFMREYCQNTPTLVDIRALKNSPEWKSLSARAQKMYNTIERYRLRDLPSKEDEEVLYDSVVVKPINLHGTFG